MVEDTVFSNVNSRTCVSFKMLYTGQTHNQTDNNLKVTTNEQKMKSKVTTYLICVCLFKWNYCIISSLSYSSQQHGRIGSDASIRKQDKTECKLRQKSAQGRRNDNDTDLWATLMSCSLIFAKSKWPLTGKSHRLSHLGSTGLPYRESDSFTQQVQTAPWIKVSP